MSTIISARRAVAALASLLVLIGTATAAESQSATPAATAGCAAQLDWAAHWARRNYSGYEDKVGAAAAAYDSLVGVLRGEALAARDDAACDPILRRWVAFFRDGHIYVGRPRAASGSVAQAGTSDDEIRARFAAWPRVRVDEQTVRARLGASAPGPLDGIWESADGAYRVAMVPDTAGGAYLMTILRADSVWWMPGQVKARLARDGEEWATRFYMRDHAEQAWRGRLVRNVLRFQNGSAWVRTWPRAEGDVTPEGYRATMNIRFHARELAPGTVLLQIPTFNDARRIDSLMAAEGARIRGADRLIVDVRGNGGGSDFNFREIAPLLYTQPVRMVSTMSLATEENNRANELLVADTTIPAGQRAQIRSTLDRVKAAGTRWYAFDDRVTEGTMLEKPRKVAVLVDRGCASSCEQFLLVALQSAKTRLYGTNSAGVLDYGNVRRADMPGSTLTLWHATTRSKRVPAGQGIDGVGIPPHEPIPADVAEPIAWLVERLAREP